MLAAYTSGEPIDAYITHAKTWLAHSYQRDSCDDAYSDLLLATEQYGAARAHVAYVADLQKRLALAVQLDRLMAALLVRSHELRERCRTPLR